MTIKAIKRKEFFKPILKSAVRLRRPTSVMFELTYRCNFRCPHCYTEGRPKEGKELDTKIELIEQMKVFPF